MRAILPCKLSAEEIIKGIQGAAGSDPAKVMARLKDKTHAMGGVLREDDLRDLSQSLRGVNRITGRWIMNFKSTIRLAQFLAAVGAALAFGSAFAGPKCTDEPESKWLTAEQMTKKFTEMGYTDEIKKLHVSKGKCWEIYGHDKKSGKKVEIYFHPITAEIMEKNVKD
ncbi:MAG: PepSY domain-containing protein [Burkholderiaceae bacterium]